jgi:hypothetical protein
MARAGAMRCCPWINGSKKSSISAIKKINEIAVTLVALFVLLEFRNIPYGCQNTFKNRCLDMYLEAGGLPETDRFD